VRDLPHSNPSVSFSQPKCRRKRSRAHEDMATLREYINDLAEDVRQIQPGDPHEE
jgi:hypothetical protein